MTTIEAKTPEAEVGRPQSDSVASLVTGYFEKLRGGDVGILPVMFGLWAWETTWPLIVRVSLVIAVAGWNLLVFLPRAAQGPQP